MKIRLLVIPLILILTACTPATGTLEFYANGENFVRQGFTSKDGWAIEFEHLYVTLTAVTAYQTNPPLDAISGQMPNGTTLPHPDSLTLDLAAGPADAPPILFGSITANTGHYNAISWEMTPLNNHPTLQMIGTATRDDQIIPFNIQIDESYRYACGEYVGNERNGFVDPNQTGTIEMTFHFDHIFGDGATDIKAPLNQGALGFDPFATLATNNSLTITQAELATTFSPTDYATLLTTLATLGHVGEGHCYEFSYGYTPYETP